MRKAGSASLAALLLAGGVGGALSAGTALAENQKDITAHGGATRLSGDQSKQLKEQIDSGKAKNVILLIGDGMGDSEITSARYYEYGAAGRLPGIDALPFTGQYTTYSVKKGTDQPDYVPDSAATGSAWATGTKTYDNAVSVDTNGVPQASLLELAKANGLKTGNVTTAEIQDATPAVQASHISARSCYGPEKTSTSCASEALENGGLGSITEQILQTRADVTLGGGSKTFSETAKAGQYEGVTLLDQAEQRGYNVVDTKDELATVTKADQDEPLLGLFSSGNMDVRWATIPATNGGANLAAQRCEDNASRNADQPTLADMTEKAIDLLENQDGFFLQVEGASIDKQDHAANACGQIGETIDLDEAVQVALAYAKKQGNTSVFVTADHAHTSQIVDGNTPGLSVNLLTNEGSELKISYGTSAAGGSQQHTGSQLRVAGYGPKAANVVGLTDQTDLFFTIRDALGLKTVANPTAAPVIEQAPASVTVAEGGSASFEATTDDTISTYQWQIKKPGTSSFTDIVGERSLVLTLPKVALADSGTQLRLVATNAKGSTASAAATLTVTRNTSTLLSSLTAPKLSGTAKVGSTLTASAGTWNVDQVSVSYQWLRSGKSISGATGTTYKVGSSDIGKAITVRVTAKKSGYTSASAYSLSSGVVPKVSAKVTAKGTKKSVTVEVTASGVKPATGKVTVYEGKKILKSNVSLKNGSAKLTFSKLKKGTHKLKVVYAGSSQVNSATKTITVKVK